MMKPRLTLRLVFLLSLLGLALLLGGLFSILFYGTQKSILQSSELLRREVGERQKVRVAAFVDQATEVLDNVERDLQHRLVSIDNPANLETALYTQVLNHPDISELTLTHADATGRADFHLVFAPANRWQLSVYRGGDGNDPDWIIARRVERHDDGIYFASDRDTRPGKASSPPTTQPDPTLHPTFDTLTYVANLQDAVWSDLHWSELAAGGEHPHSRVEVTVQKDVFDSDGKFLGVVRVGLLERKLNEIIRRGSEADDGSANNIRHACFVCDSQGRLITPVTDADRLANDGDDIRIKSPAPPAEIAAALQMPALHAIADAPVGGPVVAGGKTYLATFIPLTTQGWVLGVIASQESYLGGVLTMQRRLLTAAILVMSIILLSGAITLRAVRSGLTRVMAITSRMREFDFMPSGNTVPFLDMQAVMDSLEQAKTAMRAMGKYVPLALVRDLYHMNREPTLGGELRELTIMFTDIEGFTSLSEMLPPDRLAVALGFYFQAMTAAIHEEGGTIDKYIGDAVMAMWNAPAPCGDGAARACAAALACRRATRRVYESSDWRGLPPLVTRCGVHRDWVMVGHFGSPDRMSYTALGDGVNLASRLEGLNKYFGTTIIVSEMVQQEARRLFQFRLLDRVAVKGKMHAIKVYELAGLMGEAPEQMATIQAYEAALHMYWNRDFMGALQLFEANGDDRPSIVLAERCREFIAEPPAANWGGEFMSTMK